MITYLILGTLLASAVFAIGIVSGMILAAIEVDNLRETAREIEQYRAYCAQLKNSQERV